MDPEVQAAYEQFRKNLDGHEPRDFADPEPWSRPEDSPLYVDLSGLNAESNELGAITTFPMHRRRFKKSKHLDLTVVATGAAKCKVFGHMPVGLRPEDTCKECGKTRLELEALGDLWDGKSPLKG
jgi:hypothetical protein